MHSEVPGHQLWHCPALVCCMCSVSMCHQQDLRHRHRSNQRVHCQAKLRGQLLQGGSHGVAGRCCRAAVARQGFAQAGSCIAILLLPPSAIYCTNGLFAAHLLLQAQVVVQRVVDERCAAQAPSVGRKALAERVTDLVLGGLDSLVGGRYVCSLLRDNATKCFVCLQESFQGSLRVFIIAHISTSSGQISNALVKQKRVHQLHSSSELICKLAGLQRVRTNF
mmetsp:Transcript_99939/g.182286  ORF Transcript_99939/g.182286 Transcript_99939/m.182286 type:complete len:222 (-) Transcript_99939:66-731(-)